MTTNNLAKNLETLTMTFINMTASDSISEEFIKNQLNDARFVLEKRHKEDISEEILQSVIRKIHSNLNVSMDKGIAIVDRNTQHKSWLPYRRAEMDFFFWNRFMSYLQTEKNWNTDMVDTLDNVTDDIIDLLGDPMVATPWKRKGLILGDVQSGKTFNYTAICNKAVDAGYKVIILLTGTLENLRKQTQERLDSDFVGRDSREILSRDVKNSSIGVGRFNQQKSITTFTSVSSDFNSNMLNNLGYSLRNSNVPVLFVVKKNNRILKNLDKWLRIHNADDRGIIDLPMLLIDDEADNASVNTRADEDPTAINESIRMLLNRFSRSTYLGVTATPFANIFINPESEGEMLGDDLFPSDFIYSLSPPTNYIGSNALFGENAMYEDRLEEINDVVIPEKKKGFVLNSLPKSMCESLGYFLLVNAIRDYRGDNTTHRSMLINVSHLTAVQDQFSAKINTWLKKMRSDIKNFNKLALEESLQNSSLRFLYEIWSKYDLSKVSGTDWKTIQTRYLHNAVSPIEVRSVNQRTGSSSLNFNANKDNGLRVIAVGGYSLSRGLTLEGLAVSYFYRNSKMYDTLMQMGRWFGYRAGYEDLFRIWMKPEAINWYRSITFSINELRDEIRKMNRDDKTPSEFGLKVRYDPEALLVTARNKMKHAKTVDCLISVSGRLLETPRLPADKELLKANYKAFINIVNKLDQAGQRDKTMKENFWSNVSKEYIVELLNSFSVDPSDLKFYLNHLPDYIDSADHLSNWDVYIPTGKGSLETENIPEDIKIKKRERKIMINSGTILVNEKKVRVGTGGETKIGLTPDQVKRIESQLKKDDPDKSPSDTDYLISGRKPLLILHVIEPTIDRKKTDFEVPLIAIGLGFPTFARGIDDKLVKYVLNPVEIKNRLLFEEDDENDDA